MTYIEKTGCGTLGGCDSNEEGRPMFVTTSACEENSNWVLTVIEEQERCKWCGCPDDQRYIGPRSKLCKRCQQWDRKERSALEWKRNNPHLTHKEAGLPHEYCIQFAKLCREEGQIHTWKGPITPLQLETTVEDLTEQFFGRKDKISHTLITFAQFNGTQRRLLMYLFERMQLASLQHRRRDIARQRTLKEVFSI